MAHYGEFTNGDFEKVAFESAHAPQEAVFTWKAITAELTRLGEISLFRTSSCSVEAGNVGCKLVDHSLDEDACEWSQRLGTLLQSVGDKCNKFWNAKFSRLKKKILKSACKPGN